MKRKTEGQKNQGQQGLPPKRPSARSTGQQAPLQRSRYNIPPSLIDIPTGRYDPASSIDQQKTAQLQRIIEQLEPIGAARSSPGNTIGFRFYDPDSTRGLASLAEQNKQQELPPGIRNQFLRTHATANKKTIVDNGRTYYSPFVSLTGNLPNFLNTSFAAQGDVNIRHDVLHRSPKLGVFDVPSNLLVSPRSSNPDQDLSQREQELLFDSSTGRDQGLASFLRKGHDNPFVGEIAMDFNKLLRSRGLGGDHALSSRVLEYEGERASLPQKESLNEGQRVAFERLQKERDALQEAIFKQDPIHETRALQQPGVFGNQENRERGSLRRPTSASTSSAPSLSVGITPSSGLPLYPYPGAFFSSPSSSSSFSLPNVSSGSSSSSGSSLPAASSSSSSSGYGHGGRVTGKNLLSRFKKTRHKLI